MKKKLIYLCLLSLLSLFMLAACRKKEENNNPQNYLSGIYYAQINLRDYGPITLELDADAAPATVTNFVNLINEDFYDGLTFHRIIDGFMIQGGDPEGNGTGGSANTIPGEFEANGFHNPISHVRGTISMARANDYDSASSQFFIVQQDSTDLDGSYAAFGRVIAGMDVVDAICALTPVEDANGTVLAENQPIITHALILELEDVSYEEIIEDIPVTPAIPESTAEITFSPIDSDEGWVVKDRWIVNEDGKSYMFFSSQDLLKVSLYPVDAENGLIYDESNPTASCSDIAANECITMRISLPDGLPAFILVAEEHSGAIAKYLVCYDANHNGYLAPFFE